MRLNMFTLVLLALLPVAVSAQVVPPTTAEQVARNFWNLHRDKGVQAQTTPMQQLNLHWDAFYIFSPTEAPGFVVVAADDRVRPVLAYSFHNAALRDTMSPEMSWWLDGWQQQVDYCRQANLKATSEVTAEWEQLQYGTGTPRPLTVVAPMLSTQWDQNAPYNDSCPPAPNSGGYIIRGATGCVATAMAQIMRYWSYPQRGTGSHTYRSYVPEFSSTDFGVLHVDFSATTYDWDHMPNTVTRASSEVERAAVATLMYHCGVAVDMMYGTAYEGGSGAFIHPVPGLRYGSSLNGMINYFGYSTATVGIDRSVYPDSAWNQLVKMDIDAARPVLYAGGDENSGAHCFVCDGYDEQGRYHFNWGWSGMGDGYYTLNNLAPGMGGTGGGTGTFDFTNGQQMLFGLHPAEGDDSLCIIRNFPYVQQFEIAPTCWYATATSDYSYSWMVMEPSDVEGVMGKYSAVVLPPDSASEDHLLSPYIITPGNYQLTYQARSVSDSIVAHYTLSVDTVQLTDSVGAEWVSREVSFTLQAGDTAVLDFAYDNHAEAPGMMVDDITITRTNLVGITTAEELRPIAYPNPTTGKVTLGVTGRNLRVEVLDITGRKLLTTTQNIIDLTAYPDGIYLLRCVSATGVQVLRVVKKQ